MENRDQENFIGGYLECALWSSTLGDDCGTPMDQDHTIDDLAPETIEAMREDCIDFLQANAISLTEYVEHYTYTHAGHDFWLTRNGHGAGFWDRCFDFKKLSDASRQCGECDLYIGDDGRIYK